MYCWILGCQRLCVTNSVTLTLFEIDFDFFLFFPILMNVWSYRCVLVIVRRFFLMSYWRVRASRTWLGRMKLLCNKAHFWFCVSDDIINSPLKVKLPINIYTKILDFSSHRRYIKLPFLFPYALGRLLLNTICDF